MSKFNKNKFVFHEFFINESGKQSGSAFIGILMGLTVVVAFIIGIIGFFLKNPFAMEYFEKVLQLGGLSALLMGVRKAAGAWGNGKDNGNNEGKG